MKQSMSDPRRWLPSGRWLVAAAWLLLFGGCAAPGPYRTVAEHCDIEQPGHDDHQAIDWEAGPDGTRPCGNRWQVAVHKPVPFSMNFVEVDEQGVLASRAQAEAAIDNASAVEPEGSYVVVFVHGWHHNASTEDVNVRNFYGALALASRWNPNRKVKGIYVGWRGDSLAVPGLRYATFWDRKDTSDEVGRGGLLEFLLRLERGVKPDAGSRNRLVVVGHSFGASVTFNALAHLYLERFLDGVYAQGDGPRFRGYGDLVVLVNPAIEAMRFMPFQSALDYYSARTVAPKVDFSHETKPALVVLSSSTDSATRVFFRAARLFSTVFESHAKVSATNSPDPAGTFSEWNMDLETVGNFRGFQTHPELRLAPRAQGKGPATNESMDAALLDKCDSLTPQQLRQALDTGGDFPDSGVRIEPRRQPAAMGSPYILADVSSDIVDGHTGIGGPNLVCWINQLLDTKESTLRPLRSERQAPTDADTAQAGAAPVAAAP